VIKTYAILISAIL